ncbi:hypothetical protein PT300_12185 [Enterobacteriaceae bacterium ESL0689]|nr:hypothetical protein [Enterobacteriaceae bacterium ESL0689]
MKPVDLAQMTQPCWPAIGSLLTPSQGLFARRLSTANDYPEQHWRGQIVTLGVDILPPGASK